MSTFLSNLKIENSSMGPWSSSEDGGISCHHSRFNFPQDTNKLLGPAASPCCILEISTSTKETSSDFQYLFSEICCQISIKSDIYDILSMSSIHGLYDFRHVYREHNMSVDHLSKEALNMKVGLLPFS